MVRQRADGGRAEIVERERGLQLAAVWFAAGEFIPRSLLGEPPFIDRDATKPDEAFFKNVDYVVNRANELGLVLVLDSV